MIAATIDAAVGAVGVVLAASIPAVLTARFQRRVQAENKHDHDRNAEASRTQFAALAATVDGIAADSRDTRADVREVKETLRDHGDRLERLEPPRP